MMNKNMNMGKKIRFIFRIALFQVSWILCVSLSFWLFESAGIMTFATELEMMFNMGNLRQPIEYTANMAGLKKPVTK